MQRRPVTARLYARAAANLDRVEASGGYVRVELLPDGRTRQLTTDDPPAQDECHHSQAIGSYLTSAARLADIDTGNSAGEVRSMLGDLARGLREAFGDDEAQEGTGGSERVLDTLSLSLSLSLSHKQVRSIVQASARINIWHGAVRSGKTIASLLAVAEAPPSGLIIVLGRSLQTIERNVFEPLRDPSLFGPVAAQVRHTRGATTATVLGRTVHLIGAADARAEGRLRGLTASLAYVDELTLLPEAFSRRQGGPRRWCGTSTSSRNGCALARSPRPSWSGLANRPASSSTSSRRRASVCMRSST
ncbi:hypothetical protein [Streptomyces sp. NPDC050355]|uniref:hypothetical protein n=1 Tax=Streptomyces sp. NPDC050355 TaxID=3365609 RepID=UPI0037B926A2